MASFPKANEWQRASIELKAFSIFNCVASTTKQKGLNYWYITSTYMYMMMKMCVQGCHAVCVVCGGWCGGQPSDDIHALRTALHYHLEYYQYHALLTVADQNRFGALKKLEVCLRPAKFGLSRSIGASKQPEFWLPGQVKSYKISANLQCFSQTFPHFFLPPTVQGWWEQGNFLRHWSHLPCKWYHVRAISDEFLQGIILLVLSLDWNLPSPLLSCSTFCSLSLSLQI